jgi:hypothetical protein
MTPPFVIAGREEPVEAVYGALLHRAHVEGLYGMQVSLLQAPSPENGHTALVRAEVNTVQGLFSALGEASGEDGERAGICGAAELRAKVGALRDALDVPLAAVQALPERRGVVLAPVWPDARGERADPVAAEIVALTRAARPRLDVVRGGPQ